MTWVARRWLIRRFIDPDTRSGSSPEPAGEPSA
jgi:hypothetical protein